MKTVERRQRATRSVCPHCGSVLPVHQKDDAELTPRQTEVIRMIAGGMTAKEIAASLEVSSRTVEFHRLQLMERLGLRTTAELTRYAMAQGLV